MLLHDLNGQSITYSILSDLRSCESGRKQNRFLECLNWVDVFSRPVVYDREEDWQREKWLYVDSVTRHIRENIGAGEGKRCISLFGMLGAWC